MTRFQLDHDWQGNMSPPRAHIGEGTKTRLLLLLCALWIFLGLIGHAPWKPLESSGISIVQSILENSHFIAPLASGESTLDNPPLYYLSAAFSAKLLSPLLDLHDGARAINILWLTITLLMVGMTGRELWSRGTGRHATFIMMGTIGLITVAHSLTAEVAGLASSATGFYALALSRRRPWRASALLGASLAVGFLSYGLMPALILVSTILILPLLFESWRTRRFMTVVGVAILIASPLILAWLGALYSQFPELLSQWWQNNLNQFQQRHHDYFARILIWYAWPAFPLALWGCWHYRHYLLRKQKFQLILTFFLVALFFLGLGAPNRDIYALPLLLPLVALGAGSIEFLKRGAAAALNWFGVILFGLIGFLIWLGWIAIMTGYPVKIKTRIQFLSGLNELHFNWLAFIAAVTISLIWFLVCIRTKKTNRSTVTNWAVGMTMCWSLLMTLWLPLIDSARSYQAVFTSLDQSLPAHYTCINSHKVQKHQRQLLHYYTHITLRPIEANQRPQCDLYLIQDTKDMKESPPNARWKLIWQGKRPAERKESFRLFRLNPAKN